jgi:hypothetical protein
MLTWSSLDTPLEWGESAAAFFVILIGFAVGSFFAVRIFKILSLIALFGAFYLFVEKISQGFWNSWGDLSSAALGLGLFLAFLLAPFTTTADFEDRIAKLEKEVKPISAKQLNQ